MKGESEEALRWWETSLRLDTDQIDILRPAGKMAHGLGRYELALEFLVRAAELDSELSPAQRIAEYGSLMAEAEKVGAEAWAADLRARLSGAGRPSALLHQSPGRNPGLGVRALRANA